MKISDKMRLDWLNAHFREWGEGLMSDGDVVVFDASEYHNPRRAIDAAMRRERKRK